MKRILLGGCFILGFLVFTIAISAQTEIKLQASDGVPGDQFGYSVAIDGNVAIVGAAVKNWGTGAAYIFRRDEGDLNNWIELKKLIASDHSYQDRFGGSVAISEDLAIVGAWYDDNRTGSAYIFRRDKGGANNWGEVKKLVASDRVSSERFGISVAISGDVAIVGAFGDDDNGSFSGSAYIFHRNFGGADNWGEMKKLVASDATADDFFGESVGISGDVAIVGANGNDDMGDWTGSAYIFRRDEGGTDNWGEFKKVLASDARSNAWFGKSVAIRGDMAIVGAVGDRFKGSAYILKRDEGGVNNWGEIAKLQASDGEINDWFGNSVSIDQDIVIVAAAQDDNATGSAYIFRRDEGGSNHWGEVNKLTAGDGEERDVFGHSVDISEGVAIAGAYGQYGTGRPGSAYLYLLNQPPVAKAGPDQVIDCAPSTGSEVILDGSLSSDPDNDPLTYTWSEGATHLGGGDILTLTLLPGVHTITLTVDDGNGGSHDDEVVVTIIADTEAPNINLKGDNPLTVIRFSGPYTDPGADVTDNCDPAPSLIISGAEDVNTNLPGTYSITYNATDMYGNEAEEVFRTVNVIDDPNAFVHPYLFLSDKKIMVDKMGQAEGDMHSNDEIDIKKGPATFTGDVTACGKIDIAKDVTIDGDVTAGGELQLDNNVTITGTATEYADVSEIPLQQLSYSAGGSDVKVKKNKTKFLTPGSYGKIEVEKKGTLQLSTGDYYIEELILKEKVRFEIDVSTGPVTVNVVKKVDMNKNVTMSLSPLGEVDSRYFFINSKEDIQVDKDSRLLGFFNAPEGKVQLKKEVYLRGSICAEEIDVDKDAEALYHLAGQQPMIPEWNHPVASTGDAEPDAVIQQNMISLPVEFKLYQNFPNPFNPSTQITYTIPEDCHVTLKVFNMFGQEVGKLVGSEHSAGRYTVTWDATDASGNRVPSGLYIYVLRTGKVLLHGKMTLMK